MGKVMAGMTMSLDGFINDRNGSAQPLSPDFDELLEAPAFKKMIERKSTRLISHKVFSGE